jgi:2-polyprenyl-3-methyl-5-hydroxy-6-metoxy-1,4-benzoquinol methylase
MPAHCERSVDLKERPPGEDVRRHPWEIARARSYRRLLAAHADLAAVHRVLDIGAGDGWFASDIRGDLDAATTIVCWDVNYRSEDLATPAGAGIVRTAEQPPGPFDVVLALDVLEHIDDDEPFLADVVVPSMADGGIALLSVPAHPRLFSDHDRMLEHARRYRPRDFRDLVVRHLEVVAAGSVFASLVPLRVIDLARQWIGWPGEQRGVGAWRGGPTVTRSVTAVLDADAAVGRWTAGVGLPMPGLSTWVVARRR